MRVAAGNCWSLKGSNAKRPWISDDTLALIDRRIIDRKRFFLFPKHLFAVSAVPVQVAQDQGQTTWACQGMRLAKGGEADASARATEERRISVDIGCPGQFNFSLEKQLTSEIKGVCPS